MSHSHTVLLVMLVAALFALGCERSGTEAGSVEGRAAEWRLEQDLRLAETERFYFGSVIDVAVDEEGRMFVIDNRMHHVKVLSPEGELLNTIGSEGEGPGEFQWPDQVVLGANDSVYVSAAQGYISVFAPETHEFVYRVQAQSTEALRPARLLGVEADGFLLIYAPKFNYIGDEAPAIHRVAFSGAPTSPSLVRLRGQEYHHGEAEGVRLAMPTPFGGQPVTGVGPDGRIYHGFSDRISLSIHERDGTKRHEWTLPHEPVPVSREEREEFIAERQESGFRDLVKEIPFPEHKPAYSHLMVDSEVRAWFKRDMGDGGATWWIASPEGELLATAALPQAVELLFERDGYVYGRTEWTDGEPALVRYRIQK